MPDTSAVPSNSLTIVNPAPPPGMTGTPNNRFILFTNDWLDLQNYVQQALELPITKNDFQATYGSFPDQKLVTNAVEALKRVRDLSATFGAPTTLKQKIQTDPGYLNTPTAPTEIYAHIVWLANQIYNTSTTFQYTLANLAPLLSMGTPDQRAENLKAILIGQGGLVSSAETMKALTQDLLKKLMEFDSKIAEANEQVQKYAGQGSTLVDTANQIIGSTRNDIDNVLQPSADAAYKAWRDYTISAVTTSVGIMVLSAGMLWPLAVGLGVGLGVAAAKQREAYNDLMNQIGAAEENIRLKTRLVADLTGFNQRIGQVAPALASFKTNLEIVEGVWVGMSSNLAYIANNYSVDQLSSLPWVNQAMKIGDATAKWQAIGTTSQEFTANALVSYDFSSRWGARIPAAA
jgi:hypothetical protein